MNPKLENLKNDDAEIQKCKESPLYFYNTYMLKEGQQPVTQDEYDALVKQMELYRNAIPLRMRRGNYVFMKPIKDGVLPEYFDGKNTNRYLIDEMGQWANPDQNLDWEKALIRAKHRRSSNNLIFAKPKKK